MRVRADEHAASEVEVPGEAIAVADDVHIHLVADDGAIVDRISDEAWIGIGFLQYADVAGDGIANDVDAGHRHDVIGEEVSRCGGIAETQVVQSRSNCAGVVSPALYQVAWPKRASSLLLLNWPYAATMTLLLW